MITWSIKNPVKKIITALAVSELKRPIASENIAPISLTKYYKNTVSILIFLF